MTACCKKVFSDVLELGSPDGRTSASFQPPAEDTIGLPSTYIKYICTHVQIINAPTK